MKRFRKMLASERGFTLIELMVVVLVIGIIMAIALPTMLGARKRAQDRAAQSDLRTGVAAAKVFYTDDDTYTGFAGGIAGSAEQIEPTLAWIGGSDPGPTKAVSIAVAADGDLVIVRRSDTGIYFCIADQLTNPGYSTGMATAYADVDTVAECVGGWG